MWQFLNSNASAVQALSSAVVVLLTGVLAWATLRYVHLTKKIADSSVTQAEAVHKPVLTLKRDDLTPPTDLTELVRDALHDGIHTRVGSVLEIINIGTGPALQVTWTIDRLTKVHGFLPYLEVGHVASTHQASKVNMGAIPTTFELECRYQSLSGTRYVSRTLVKESKKVVSFEVLLA